MKPNWFTKLKERSYFRKLSIGEKSLQRGHKRLRKIIVFITTVVAVIVIAAFSVVTFAPESDIATTIENMIHSVDTAIFPAKTDTSIKKMFESKTGKLPDYFAVLSIQNKTFEVKEGIDEKTLKKNIGWWESSASIGGVGNCVIMGHRDQDLRILKFVEKGEIITATLANGDIYSYTIVETRVLNSDLELVFENTDEKRMVIITCYPFYYSGHAPKKFMLTAVIREEV